MARLSGGTAPLTTSSPTDGPVATRPTVVVCIGLSHVSAPVELRERVAYGPQLLREALDRFVEVTNTSAPGPVGAAIHEAAILHTCNRTEYYLVADRPPSPESLFRWLAPLHKLSADEVDALTAASYNLEGAAAALHLLRVAAGLKSMILGEAQVLGQVRAAGDEARGRGAAGPVLSRLFDGAVKAGRRARAETDVGRRPASVPSAAVALARSACTAGRPVVVVVGAGEMGILTAKALVEHGVESVVVTNRSLARAAELAEAWGGCAVAFDRLPELLETADIVIASTAAPHPVLRAAALAEIMVRRSGRPLVIVDIAVPRDAEPEVGGIDGVTLLDIDDLEAAVDATAEGRAEAVPQVEAIVAEETDRLMARLGALDAGPTIAALHRWAESVREAELERALRRLGRLEPREREVVRALASGLVGKLLHPAVVALRSGAGGPDQPSYAEAVRNLFALNAEFSSADPGRPDSEPVPPAADDRARAQEDAAA